METRKATARDRKQLANFLVSYWKKRGMIFSLSWTHEYLKNGMTSEMKEERFVCIDMKGNISGTIACLQYYEHVAEIRDEVWANDETGSLLLERLISYAKEKKIRKVYSLALGNKTKFYLSHGFKKEEDVTIMSRFL